ncbi:MAG: peptide-binding protein [Patescibacteria group bacterium]|nr:MAG: peptide-binding protein [Patescibacteria group bacterium]
MNSQKKIFRYYYWVLIEFFKKHSRLIILSFFISFIVILTFLSLSSTIDLTFIKEKKIGLIGNYTIDNPPDELLTKISNGLIMVDNKGKIIPILANSWEVKNNGKEYRFHLKDNLFWNDNKKFSAKDIKYNFSDVQIKAVDDRTIDFFLDKPLGIFPTYLDKPIIKYPLIGVAGYYRVGKIKTSEGFLKEVSLLPNIKNIKPLKYRFYKNENQLVTAYKKGEITEIVVYKKSIADSFSNWKNTKITKSVDYSRLLTIFFNFKNPIFENKKIREAISMLVDVNKFEQYGEVAKSPIPPNSWAYNPDIKNYNYDPETARKIIEKENIASLSSNLQFVTFFENYQIADEFVDEMNKINLSTDIKINQLGKTQDFDLLLAYLKIPVDPDQYYYWHSTQKTGNIGGYKNPKVDLLLEKARSTIDIDEREKEYFDFQKVIREDLPAIFLYFPYVYKIERK